MGGLEQPLLAGDVAGSGLAVGLRYPFKWRCPLKLMVDIPA